MAPLFDAVKVEYVGTDDNGTATFKGIMDGEWALGDTPHGGMHTSVSAQTHLIVLL